MLRQGVHIPNTYICIDIYKSKSIPCGRLYYGVIFSPLIYSCDKFMGSFWTARYKPLKPLYNRYKPLLSYDRPKWNPHRFSFFVLKYVTFYYQFYNFNQGSYGQEKSGIVRIWGYWSQEKQQFCQKSGIVRKTGVRVRKSQDFRLFCNMEVDIGQKWNLLILILFEVD